MGENGAPRTAVISMKLGFIGCGNMASAIIKGVSKSALVSCSDIVVYDKLEEKSKSLSTEIGICVAKDENEVASSCDVVVLAVKPNVFEHVLPLIDGSLKQKNPLIISIAAGKSISFIEGLLSYSPAVARVMPNINATVLESVSAYCCNGNVSDEQEKFTADFCSSFGKAVALDEAYFAIYGVIGGCSPAYVYMFIDAMARAAVKNGMPKDKALQVSAQAVLGSAKMVLEGGDSPWNLVDKVCSPGGTTIEGVLSLQRDGFEAAVANAVQASFEKDKKL